MHRVAVGEAPLISRLPRLVQLLENLKVPRLLSRISGILVPVGSDR